MRQLFDEFGHGSLPRLPRHKNPGLEIVYLRHGHLVWESDGKEEAVRPDSIYFTLPWQAHGSVMEFEPGHEWYFVVIRLRGADTAKPRRFGFPSELAFDAATTAAVRRLLMRAPRHAWPATPLARVLLPALVAELERPGLLYRARVIQMTGQLILELARILSLPESPGERRDAERFSQLLTELDRTCDQPWMLGQMAARLRLKRTQFSTLFRHAIGDAPMHYLNRLRVEKSRRLLQATKKSITYIALECGFSSSQHFARVFQQFTGETATAYRRQGPPPLLLPRKQRWK